MSGAPPGTRRPPLEQRERPAAVEACQGDQQLVQHLLHPCPRADGMLHGAHDHRVLGAGDVVADQELLEELLAGRRPGILDLDVAVRVDSRRAP